jgi:hypothetical protein
MTLALKAIVFKSDAEGKVLKDKEKRRRLSKGSQDVLYL